MSILDVMWWDDLFDGFFNDLPFDEPERRQERFSPRRTKASIKPSALNGMLDWEEDPVGAVDGRPDHLLYARIIPFLAAGTGFRIPHAGTAVKAYVEFAKATLRAHGVQDAYLRAFVLRTLGATEHASDDERERLEDEAREKVLEFADQDTLVKLARNAARLAGCDADHPFLRRFVTGMRRTIPFRRTEESAWLKELGLSDGASNQDIIHAWHTLVKRYHPDANVGREAEAERKTIRINEAYRQLRSRRGF